MPQMKTDLSKHRVARVGGRFQQFSDLSHDRVVVKVLPFAVPGGAGRGGGTIRRGGTTPAPTPDLPRGRLPLRRLSAFFAFFAFLGALLRDLDDCVEALLATFVPVVPVLADPFSCSMPSLESEVEKVGMAPTLATAVAAALVPGLVKPPSASYSNGSSGSSSSVGPSVGASVGALVASVPTAPAPLSTSSFLRCLSLSFLVSLGAMPELESESESETKDGSF
jgi:hypothetical protein